MEVFDQIAGLREYVAATKRSGRRVVFVPTMGALHAGHGACVRTGRDVKNSTLIVSIYVNPTQFAPGEDLDRYPRTLEADLALCRQWGVDAVFTPAQEHMYPPGRPGPVWVTVENLTESMCGRTRPGHFRGVATVVAKLLNLVQPDVAVFGQKDAQQALVIREMVTQLAMPVELRLAAIEREKDGLARSSRNRYLGEKERPKAAALHRALAAALETVRSGLRDPAAIVDNVREDLSGGGVGEIEYVEIRNASDLCALETLEDKVILAVAAYIGSTRLIDNVVFTVQPDGTIQEELLF